MRRLLVRWPIKVEKSEMSLNEASELGLRTEPFVNERYRLSYLGRRGTAVTMPEEPARRRSVLGCARPQGRCMPHERKCSSPITLPADVFQAAQFGTQTQASVPPNVRPGRAAAPRRDRGVLVGRMVMLLLAGGLIAVGFFVVVLKHSSLIRAAERLDELKWDRDDWMVPTIELKSFRRNGKVAKLNAIEVGYLCEMPLKTLTGLMILEMEHRGVLKVLDQDPLKLDPSGRLPTDATRYHRVSV